MADDANAEVELLSANRIYPMPLTVFQPPTAAVETVKDTCIYVLDTNVLLVPYETGKESLAAIKTRFENLAKQRRLVIPGQVAREFAKHRAAKLCELHQNLLDKKSAIRQADVPSYPLLESVPEYRELRDGAESLNAAVRLYGDALSALVEVVRRWNWDDPVSQVYRQCFDASVFVEVELLPRDLKDELEWRSCHKVPPGYKDVAKADEGLGDLVIWKTILHLGGERKQACVFVTGEKKSDWYHRSANFPLYPRFELVDEYARSSNGRSFHIIDFARFLQLQGAPDEVVEQVRISVKDVLSAAHHAAEPPRGKDEWWVWRAMYERRVRSEVERILCSRSCAGVQVDDNIGLVTVHYGPGVWDHTLVVPVSLVDADPPLFRTRLELARSHTNAVTPLYVIVASPRRDMLAVTLQGLRQGPPFGGTLLGAWTDECGNIREVVDQDGSPCDIRGRRAPGA